jgi:hypothetical protein
MASFDVFLPILLKFEGKRCIFGLSESRFPISA